MLCVALIAINGSIQLIKFSSESHQLYIDMKTDLGEATCPLLLQNRLFCSMLTSLAYLHVLLHSTYNAAAC